MSEQQDSSDLEDLRLEAQAWVVWIRSGGASAGDTADLMRWRARSPDHARVLAEAVRVRRLIALAGQEEEDAPVQSRGRAVLPPPASRGGGRPAIGRRAFIGGALAASAAGVMIVHPPLSLWPSLAELRSDYRTGTGERRTITLAKGASVELNTRTSIALRSDAHGDGLKLISGEVAIDAPGAARPVTILTQAGEVVTRAGRLGVRLTGGDACVTCFAGEVLVANTSGQRAQLVAGQQLTYSSDKIGDVVSIDPVRIQAWRRGLLTFSDEPLSHVVDEVNRYRPGKIIVTNTDLGRVRINAVFQLDRVDTAVAQIRDVSSARVTTLPGGVVLLS